MAIYIYYVADYAIVVDTVSGTDSRNPLYNFQTIIDTVTVTEETVANSIYLKIDTINVQDIIGVNIVRNVSLIQTLPIYQNVISYSMTNVDGNTGNVFVDPAIIAYENALTPPGNVTFTCNNTTITLRKPDFGDDDKYEKFRVMRSTFGGDQQVFQDSIWPEYETLSMTWIYLSQEQANNLLTFFQVTLGQIMTFHNQFGESFKGYILTPTDKITQPKVHGWAASLTFQLDMNLTKSDPGLPGSGNTIVNSGDS